MKSLINQSKDNLLRASKAKKPIAFLYAQGKPFLFPNNVGTIYAQPGRFKSTFCGLLASTVLYKNKNWINPRKYDVNELIGFRYNTRDFKDDHLVIYFDLERRKGIMKDENGKDVDTGEFWAPLDDIRYYAGYEDEDASFGENYFHLGRDDLLKENGEEDDYLSVRKKICHLIQFIHNKYQKPMLVIIDNMHHLVRSVNSEEETKEVAAEYKQLGSDTGACILVVQHENIIKNVTEKKSSAAGWSGTHGEIMYSMTAQLLLLEAPKGKTEKPSSKIVQLQINKGRLGGEYGSIYMKMIKEEIDGYPIEYGRNKLVAPTPADLAEYESTNSKITIEKTAEIMSEIVTKEGLPYSEFQRRMESAAGVTWETIRRKKDEILNNQAIYYDGKFFIVIDDIPLKAGEKRERGRVPQFIKKVEYNNKNLEEYGYKVMGKNLKTEIKFGGEDEEFDLKQS